jgi:hypothetical protein
MIYQNSSAKKPVGETLSPSSNVLAKEETASQAAKKLNGRGKKCQRTTSLVPKQVKELPGWTRPK